MVIRMVWAVPAGMKTAHAETFRFGEYKCTGGILSPFHSYLLLRGVKTLAVRMSSMMWNGRVVAGVSGKEAWFGQYFYPGSRCIRSMSWRKWQQRGFGSMISFELGSLEAANRFATGLKLCDPAESLGGVETLIMCHPATMTHAAVGAEGRKKLASTDGLLKLRGYRSASKM